MEKWLVGVIGVLVIAGAAYVVATNNIINLGFHSDVCYEDHELNSADTKSIGSAATAITQAVLSGQDAAAYEILSPELQQHVPRAAFANFIKTSAQLGPFRDPKLAHLYLLDTHGSGPDARAICGTLDGNWVSVAIKPGLRQAYAVFTAETQNNGWEFVYWLVPNGDSWRLQDIHISTASVAGHDARDLLDMARRERDAGRSFNATMLYAGAKDMAGRGPAFQLAIGQTLDSDLKAFVAPPELRGATPLIWTLNGKEYRVTQVALIGIGKQLGLGFVLPQTVWTNSADVDARNREFLDGFRAKHPDYAKVFSFLVGRAMKPDNSGGFGTAYDNQKGYSP
jgi:hypothetical protein